MSPLSLKSSGNLANYSVLLSRVRQTIALGKERAADAVELERVRTKWEVGKLILDHILLNNKRGKYGKEVFKRLAKDLGTSETELKYMVEYARSNSNRPHAGDLTWDKQRDLLAVNDVQKRNTLILKAAKEKWSRNDIRREIGKLRASKQIAFTQIPERMSLEAKKGIPYTYRIVPSNRIPGTGGKETSFRGPLLIDLGFSCYFELPAKDQKRFKEEDFVRLNADRLSRTTDVPLFTYHAEVLEVTDADTLWVLVHLGFGFTTKQHLRLRGLDAAEIATRDGQEAKRFVEKRLKAFSSVIITTSKSDKYDRYLADVFISAKPSKLDERGRSRMESDYLYLNQKLIDEGLAFRVSV